MRERSSPPREAPGKWKSLALTLAVHFGLLLFLFFGIRWQSAPPASLEVELTGAPAQVASAPPPPKPAPQPEPPKPEPKPEPPPPKPEPPKPEPPKPEPKPAPPKIEPKPEIATKAPEKKPEPPKSEPKPEAKPEPKPQPKPEPPKVEPKPVAKPEPKPQPKPEPKPVQDDYMKELLAKETKAAQDARLESMLRQEAGRAGAQGDMDKYKLAVAAKVRGNLLRPPGLSGNPEATFEVDQLPSGEVLAIRLKRSSGVADLDVAIERAIRRSSPLPLPANATLFQRTLELKFRPLADD